MIPSALLTTEASVELYQGNSSVGATYGSPATVMGRFDGRRRLVKRPDGSEVICSGTFTMRPDENVTMLSRVTIDGRAYIVEDVLPLEGLSRTEFIELLLS